MDDLTVALSSGLLMGVVFTDQDVVHRRLDWAGEFSFPSNPRQQSGAESDAGLLSATDWIPTPSPDKGTRSEQLYLDMKKEMGRIRQCGRQALLRIRYNPRQRLLSLEFGEPAAGKTG